MVRIALVLAALLSALLAVPMHARASDTETSMMFDDDQLIYVTPQRAETVLEQMRNLGADQVKVTVYWGLIAPKVESRQKPRFDESNPSAYPAGAWDRWDAIDRDATKLGMSVSFMVQGRAPVWARAPLRSQGPPLSRMPKLSDWQQFVEAVGKRYDGRFKPGGSRSVLPRVSEWELWNEPNESSWLTPWYQHTGGRTLYTQPEEYRSLLDTAWKALMDTGHRGDTILIGETANRGKVDPIPFLRDLYCVGRNNKLLRGAAAAAVFCPTSGTPASFRNAHPGLFYSSGYAHHPYTFDVAPDKLYPNHTWIGIKNISTMENALNGAFSAYGVAHPGGVGLYLTEWGYETSPPDPYVHTTLTQQATWLNEGEYETYKLPYIRTVAQFELVDNGPKGDTDPSTTGYWSTFQTGLEYADGTHKPSFAAWQIPIWLPDAHPGSRTVWGQLRPADHSQIQYGVVEYQANATSTWTTLAEIPTTSSEGFLQANVDIPGNGNVRLAWLNPFTGVVDYSRTVAIT